jgi:hypothetical protein
MNIINLVLLLASINLSLSSFSIKYRSCLQFYGNQLRNSGFRLIIFKKKTFPKLETKIKNFYELCYNKSLASIFTGINEYSNLSEEEKLLIDTIIGLCF